MVETIPKAYAEQGQFAEALAQVERQLHPYVVKQVFDAPFRQHTMLSSTSLCPQRPRIGIGLRLDLP